jgi:NAD(P)-dependent dehydrogenase (short-subunit alcohol dehydrogenase family)
VKTALVTGAGKGLGRGFAEFLAANDYFVYAGVHNPADAKNRSAVRCLPLDVRDDASIRSAIDLIKREQGKIDFLVNNAGLNKDSATGGHKEKVSQLNSLERQLLLKMFDVNAVGPLMVIKQAISLMTARQAFIINISSDRASFANVMNDKAANYGYKASKAALNMFTKALLFDLPKNVAVIAVHPGGVRTDMNPNGVLEPREAAENIYQIVQNWQPQMNGLFVHNDGSKYDF